MNPPMRRWMFALHIGLLHVWCCYGGIYLDSVSKCIDTSAPNLTVDCKEGHLLYGEIIAGINDQTPCTHIPGDCTGIAAVDLQRTQFKECLEYRNSNCTIYWSSKESILRCPGGGYKPASYIHLYKVLCTSGSDQVLKICNGNISQTTGYIQDPHYPYNYPDTVAEDCNLHMAVPAGHCVMIKSVFFQLRDNDYFQISSDETGARVFTDGDAISEKFCTGYLSIRYFSDGNLLDHSKTRYGFLVGFKVIPSDNISVSVATSEASVLSTVSTTVFRENVTNAVTTYEAKTVISGAPSLMHRIPLCIYILAILIDLFCNAI